MQNKYVRFVIFLTVNFLALAIGSWLMNNGPRSDWYLSLNKAPWTPPGFVFGLAWSTIMVCFAFYMTKLSFQYSFLYRKLVVLYSMQWILNVAWNYTFFNQQRILLGFLVLLMLFVLLVYFFFIFKSQLKKHTFFLLPYLLWMLIAISLNGFILVNN